MADPNQLNMQQPAPDDLIVEAGPSREGKSQARVVWEQFSSHKAALVGGGVLIFM